MTPRSETQTNQIARRIRECCGILQQGCGNAGPQVAHITKLNDPLDCPECAARFVEAVRRAFSEYPTAAQPGEA